MRRGARARSRDPLPKVTMADDDEPIDEESELEEPDDESRPEDLDARISRTFDDDERSTTTTPSVADDTRSTRRPRQEAAPAAVEEDDDEELEDDDVEASLDEILKERLVVPDEEEDDEEEVPDTEDRTDGATKVLPKQPDEFVCQSCFLVKHPSQLADAKRQLCRDCV